MSWLRAPDLGTTRRNGVEECRMKRICFIFSVMALLIAPAAAQDKADRVSPTSTVLLVSGQPIRGKVLEIDGRHYVAIEDLAQSLHGAIGYGEGQISLTLPQPKLAVDAPPQAAVPDPVNLPQTAPTPAPELAT